MNANNGNKIAINANRNGKNGKYEKIAINAYRNGKNGKYETIAINAYKNARTRYEELFYEHENLEKEHENLLDKYKILEEEHKNLKEVIKNKTMVLYNQNHVLKNNNYSYKFRCLRFIEYIEKLEFALRTKNLNFKREFANEDLLGFIKGFISDIFEFIKNTNKSILRSYNELYKKYYEKYIIKTENTENNYLNKINNFFLFEKNNLIDENYIYSGILSKMNSYFIKILIDKTERYYPHNKKPSDDKILITNILTDFSFLITENSLEKISNYKYKSIFIPNNQSTFKNNF